MFILAFFIIVSISTLLTNIIMKVDESNPDSYSYDKKSSIQLVLIFIVGVALQISGDTLLSPKYYLGVLIAYVLVSITVILLIAQARKRFLEKRQADIIQIYEILQPIVDKKNVGLDLANIPFSIEYKNNKIYTITIQIDPINFKEELAINCISQLNKYFSDSEWLLDVQHENRIAIFKSANKPPKLAMWPGSWLRPAGLFPLGISGAGEAYWNLSEVKLKNYGKSQYVDEKGIRADVKETISAPQALCVGATGGGKAICTNQEIKTKL